MSKYSLSAASLVAAIPAGFLAYVLVMAFLQKPGFNEMAGFFQIISGLTLALVTLTVLMPLGILIFGKKPEKAEKKETAQEADEDKSETAAAADEEEDFANEEEAGFDDEDFADDEFDDEDDEFK